MEARVSQQEPQPPIQHSSLHRETHLDGLQVYFNPYAEIPFDPTFTWPSEVALNYYDVESANHVAPHPDGALVSRQVFEPTLDFLRVLLESNGFLAE